MLIPGFKRTGYSTSQHFYLYWLVLGIVTNGLCESTIGFCTSFNELGLPIHTLFILIPIFLLSVQQLSNTIQDINFRLRVIWIPLLIGFLTLAVNTVPLEISPSYGSELYFDPRVILLLSNLALAFVFLSAMAFIYFSGEANLRRAQQFGLGFICLFSFAALQPTREWSQQHRIPNGNIISVFSDYEQFGDGFPLYFSDAELANKTNYLSGFSQQNKIGFIENTEPFKIVSDPQLFEELEAFILIQSSNDTPLLPATWWLVSEHDQIDGSKLQLYRSLSDITAKNLSIQATELVSQEPSAKNFERLYGALLNNNEPCNAYQAWMRSMEIGSNSGYIQIDTSANCICPQKNHETVNLTTSIETIYPGVYISIDAIETPIDDFSRISNVYAFYQDPRTFKIPVTVDPDQFYSYSVDVRANAPVIGLFIKVGEEEWYLPQRSYPNDWAHLEVLFSTHAWDSQQEVILSPALFEPGSLIDVKNYELVQTSVCADQ